MWYFTILNNNTPLNAYVQCTDDYYLDDQIAYEVEISSNNVIQDLRLQRVLLVTIHYYYVQMSSMLHF